ncbi:MAG: universal stress protein [Desulfovermiculus sp.]|nr:universal stress protein [Desulfovermiculus sp.]
MHKHILLTISDDPGKLYGVKFVNEFFKNKDTVRFTLFFIAPRTGRDVEFELDQHVEETCDLALETARQRLIRGGFGEENILCKIKKQSMSKVKDIIHEANRGLYDALVLGRRGISRLEELINDSVSMRALEQERKSPIWICREPDPGRRNVLLCVDGSEPSLHIADHIGFMLKNEDSHAITLFHVSSQGSKGEEILGQAQDELIKNGIASERISTKYAAGNNPEQVIVQEATAGKYAVVAAGYAEKPKSGLFRLGSTSKKLAYNLQGAALWLT